MLGVVKANMSVIDISKTEPDGLFAHYATCTSPKLLLVLLKVQTEGEFTVNRNLVSSKEPEAHKATHEASKLSRKESLMKSLAESLEASCTCRGEVCKFLCKTGP